MKINDITEKIRRGRFAMLRGGLSFNQNNIYVI